MPFLRKSMWAVTVNCQFNNFCGVLILVIFVVDLAVTKFSHPQKIMPTVIYIDIMRVHDDGCGHKHRSSVANASQC